MTEPARTSIADTSDVGVARIRTHRLALAEGFSEVAATALALAVSELAQNALVHAGAGVVVLAIIHAERSGITAVIRDQGPGIADVEAALRDGYSTTGSLGLGLPSARRLVDELELCSTKSGTTVTVTKWR